MARPAPNHRNAPEYLEDFPARGETIGITSYDALIFLYPENMAMENDVGSDLAMRHQDIWRGIDGLAEQNALTPSGLARLAGLDPTAFNPSKRYNKDGRPRWPSTESVAAVLDAVDASFGDFANLVEGHRGPAAPLLGFAEAGREGYFDDAGFPVGEGWDEVRFPGLGDEPVYALEVSGNSMQPTYRPGDRIVVAPGGPVRRGDRVVVKTAGGEVMAKELGRRTERRVELLSLNPEFPPLTLEPNEILWIARIIWVSQ